MPALLAACAVSMAVYGAVFGLLVGRPLAHGPLARQIDAKLALGAAAPSPKLVILAGSNGPYSHRCEVLEAMLSLPCINAGIAVGIGLDYLFARWRPFLRPGDVVYLPMETAQYIRSRSATRVGPDAAIMLRHDRATLVALPPDRWAGALFAVDARAAIMALLETLFTALGVAPANADATTNRWGDHVGHGRSDAAGSPAFAIGGGSGEPTAADIRAGYGTSLIVAFVTWARARGVAVIGGVPAALDAVPLPADSIAAIRATYEQLGGRFLELPGAARYPRAAFYDSPDHLIEACQIAHSIRVASALGPLLARAVAAPPAWTASFGCAAIPL